MVQVITCLQKHTPFVTSTETLFRRRLWAMQEAALSPRSIAICGDVQLDLEFILQAAVWFYSKYRKVGRGLFNAYFIWHLRDIEQMVKDRSQILKSAMGLLLSNCGMFDATEPKDYVYGLLGSWKRLSQSKEIPQLLRPDYMRHTWEIYRDAAIQVITESKDLVILEGHGFLREGRRQTTLSSLENLPTWVPLLFEKPDINHDVLRFGDHNHASMGLGELEAPFGRS